MRYFLYYWIAGCIIVGPAIAGAFNRCPNDELNIADVVGTVAVWPAAVIASFGMNARTPTPCKLATGK